MKKQFLWVQITYLDETWTQEFEFTHDFQSILDSAQDGWYDEIGSTIPDFDLELYKLDYQVFDVSLTH
jgi:hypothetical protein